MTSEALAQRITGNFWDLSAYGKRSLDFCDNWKLMSQPPAHGCTTLMDHGFEEFKVTSTVIAISYRHIIEKINYQQIMIHGTLHPFSYATFTLSLNQFLAQILPPSSQLPRMPGWGSHDRTTWYGVLTDSGIKLLLVRLLIFTNSTPRCDQNSANLWVCWLRLKLASLFSVFFRLRKAYLSGKKTLKA